jgi:hypothetical protein
MIWTEYMAHNADVRNAYKTLPKNQKGKKILESYKPRWNENIKVDLTV